jgi:hypothetical protein
MNSARSASGSWNGCPAVDRRDAAFRNQKADRAGHRVQLGGDERADRAALVDGRPHQRDGRVVAVQVAAAQRSGTVSQGRS